MGKQFLSLFDFSAGLVQRGFNEANWPVNSVIDGLNVRVGPNGITSGMSEVELYDFGAGASVRHIWQAEFALDGLSYLIVAVDYSDTTKIYASLKFNPDDPQFSLVYDYGGIAGDLTIACVNDRFIINDGKLSAPLVFSGSITGDGSDWSSMRQALMSDDGENFYGVGDELVDTDPGSYVNLAEMGASGGLYICDEKTGLAGFVVEIQGAANPGVVTVVEYWNGTGWSSVGGLSDGTNGFSGSGILSFNPASAAYGEVGGLAGFWYRIRLVGYTGAPLRITRMRLKSLVAPLANIGSGIDDIALGFIYYDSSANSWKDYSLEVADGSQITFARLNDGATEDPVGMEVGDYIYIGGVDEFLHLKIELERNHTNQNVSAMSAEYWNGAAWAGAGSLVDGTSSGNKTLNQSGYLRFTTTNWKQRRIGAIGTPGYWIRLKVSSALTAGTYITEVRILNKPKQHGIYRMVSALRDRLALIGRSDAPDQIDISREGEEYGFTGPDSASVRIGGQGPITAAVEAFNQLWVCKGNEWYMLNGYNPATFAIERAETASQAPSSHYSIVSAPIKMSDGINRHGFYFVNSSGVWNFTGLQVNSASDFVRWFEGNPVRAIADNSACGLFNAARYELWWVIKFRDESGNVSRRIIVYDLTRQTWNCPFETEVNTIASVIAGNGGTEENRRLILGGTGSGKLLSLDEDEDSGKTRYCETGWLNFKTPEWEKRIYGIRLIGAFEGPVKIRLSRDGFIAAAQNELPYTYTEKDFEAVDINESFAFNFLKVGLEWTGSGKAHGLLLNMAWDRTRAMESIFGET